MHPQLYCLSGQAVGPVYGLQTSAEVRLGSQVQLGITKHLNSTIRESLAADPHPTHTKYNTTALRQHTRQQLSASTQEITTALSSPASIAPHWHDEQPLPQPCRHPPFHSKTLLNSLCPDQQRNPRTQSNTPAPWLDAHTCTTVETCAHTLHHAAAASSVPPTGRPNKHSAPSSRAKAQLRQLQARRQLQPETSLATALTLLVHSSIRLQARHC